MKQKNKHGASTGHAASPETIVIKRKVVAKTPKSKTPRFVAKVGKTIVAKNKATPATKTPKMAQKTISPKKTPIVKSNKTPVSNSRKTAKLQS